MNIKKTIDWQNDNLKSEYIDYCKKEDSFIFGCESDFEKKIGFLIDVILNDGAGTELNSHYDVAHNILENKKEFDAIWNNANKELNITFLKWININPEKTKQLLDEVSDSLNSVIDHWIKFNMEEDKEKEDEITLLMDEIVLDSNTIDEKRDCYLYFVLQNNGKIVTKKQRDNILGSAKEMTNKIMSDLQTKSLRINVEWFFEDDVVNIIRKKQGSQLLVKSATLILDKDNNFLEYNNLKEGLINGSIICNISAESLNQLWSIRKQNLLGLNLRFHIKNKKIDEQIINSMKLENNNLFWFKNNGLVIICEKYFINNRAIELTNFSIVNGGQTLYNIGSLESKQFNNNDFYVTAKIISFKDLNESPTKAIYELANSIAEATNQQKAIKEVDLIANNSRIKEVKRQFQENTPIKIFVESRRGELLSKEDKVIYPEKYQKIKAEQLLQIHHAFYNITPGTCRSGKSKLYKTKKKIDEDFTYISKHYFMYSELVILFCIHQKLTSKANLNKWFTPRDSEFSQVYTNYFMKYGQYFLLSSIQLLFIVSNDINKINYYSDQNYEWKKLPGKEYQKELVNWIQKEFEKLKINRIFSCELTKPNIDNIIEKGYINLVKYVLEKIYHKSWDRYNSNDDKTISNFGKTNKEFYLFFIDELFAWIQNKNNLDGFRELFQLGDK